MRRRHHSTPATVHAKAFTPASEEIRDEAWETAHTDAIECRHREGLIARVQSLWDATRQPLADVPKFDLKVPKFDKLLPTKSLP